MIDKYMSVLDTFGVEYEIDCYNNYNKLNDKVAVVTVVGYKNQIRIIECDTDVCLQYIDNTDYDGIPIDTDDTFETMVRNVIKCVKI